MHNRILASAIKIIANVVVVIFLGLVVNACYRRFHDSGSINWLGLLVVNSIMVAMYVVKRDARSISRSPFLWLLAFAGTCAPLALRPTATAALTDIGNVIQIVGIVAIAVSMLSLR